MSSLLDPIYVLDEGATRSITSAELAEFLRSGVARPMIDRLMKTVAEAARVEFVTLGIRDNDFYHFVSTHGFPFSSPPEYVPAGTFKKTAFAKAIECPDLSADPYFKPLGSIPVAKTWRYVANVPVRLPQPLADDGTFALSVADRATRRAAGSTLIELSKIADHIADLVWLVLQMYENMARPKQSAAAMRVLMEGLLQTQAPIALVDNNLEILECSPGFKEFQGAMPVDGRLVGKSIVANWLDADGAEAVRKAFDTGKMANDLNFYPVGSYTPLLCDFHVLAFPAARLRVGLLNIHMSSIRAATGLVREESFVIPSKPDIVHEDADVVGRFLLDTLSSKRRLLQRKGHGYLALRGWRAPIKSYQIAAVRALKRQQSQYLLNEIVTEMCDALFSLHGDMKAAVVVPVPCGHSGPGCLSEKIAEALAARIGVPMVAAFDTIAVSGSSHPKTNARRPAMTLRDAPVGQIILIDDVSTSGAHIEEARSLLAPSASAVWPIVWIAD